MDIFAKQIRWKAQQTKKEYVVIQGERVSPVDNSFQIAKLAQTGER